MAAKVDWTHPEYDAHSAQVILVNQIYDGIDEAKNLITQLSNEHNDSFATRVIQSTLDNFVERITTTMAGQITRKNVSYTDVPDNIVEDMDIVAGGNNINQFAKDITEYAVRDGQAFALVDMGIDGGQTNLHIVQREQVTNWAMNDDGLYTMVVIVEGYKELDGRFGFEVKKQYRVIDEVGNVEIWREVENEGWALYESIVTSYNFCPFYKLQIDDIPPLYDIAKINVKHLNFTSLRDRFLKEALDPILFGQNLGITDEGTEDNPTIILGVNQMMNTDNPDSNLSWVELDGSNYDLSEKHLLKLENDMSARASKIQSDSKGTKTATQVSEENSESTSRLSDITTDLENLINHAVNAYSLIQYSKELVGEVITNRDFNSAVIDSTALGTLNTLQVSGNISKKTLLEALNNSELVEIEDIDEELALIEEETLAMEDEDE